MKIGDKVRHKKSGVVWTVAHSSFGFSLHHRTTLGGRLVKTLGISKEEILEHCDLIEEEEKC